MKSAGMINKKTLGFGFLLLLIILILCSKTIYSHNLPTVNAVRPITGRLSKMEIASGPAAWAEIRGVYLPMGGVCGEILAKEGERVEAGQPLLYMDFDWDETERGLREIETRHAKLDADIRSIEQRLDRLRRASGPDGFDAGNLARDVARARQELEDAQALYEAGAISLRTLTEAEEALESLYAIQNRAAADYAADESSLVSELALKNFDITLLRLEEERYRRTLANYDAYSAIAAPVAGQLISLNARKGEKLNEYALVAEIGVGREFIVECTVSPDNNFVLPGDACALSNTSHALKGTVTKVSPSARGKTVSVSVASDEVAPGETFAVRFEKDSASTYTLAPNGALNQDNDGYFVYRVKRRDGMLGKEYYLERVNVEIGDNDSYYTAIVKGITFFEPLVLTSDKPVKADSVVKLANVGDFFVD